MVAEDNGFVEVFPRVKNGIVADTPAMEIKSLPEAAVVPVGTAGGHDGFVGGKGIEVVNATTCALQALAVFATSYVIVERGYVETIDFLQGSGQLVFTDAVAGIFLQKAAAPGQKQDEEQGGDKREESMLFHDDLLFLFRSSN